MLLFKPSKPDLKGLFTCKSVIEILILQALILKTQEWPTSDQKRIHNQEKSYEN